MLRFILDLSFIYDVLGASLVTYYLFHASTATMSVVIGLLHVLTHAHGKPNVIVVDPRQMFELIVSDTFSNQNAVLTSPLDNHMYGSVAPPVTFGCRRMKSSSAVIRR